MAADGSPSFTPGLFEVVVENFTVFPNCKELLMKNFNFAFVSEGHCSIRTEEARKIPTLFRYNCDFLGCGFLTLGDAVFSTEHFYIIATSGLWTECVLEQTYFGHIKMKIVFNIGRKGVLRLISFQRVPLFVCPTREIGCCVNALFCSRQSLYI